MSICSAGVSQPKAGTVTSIFVDQAYIQSILPAAVAWVYPYLPYMKGLEIGDVPTFCAADPPTWTVPNALEIAAFIEGGPAGYYLTVNQFLQDLTKAYLWYRLCECASVATPAPPTAPTAPSDLPAINPPGVVSPPDSVACHDQSIATAISSGTFAYDSWLWHGTPSDLASFRVTINQPQDFVAHSAPATWTIFQTTNSAVTTVETRVLPPNFNQVVDIPVVPLGTELRIQANAGYNQTAKTIIRIQGFCGTAPRVDGPSSGCCPPDPQLLATLKRLEQAVTLIQRQAVPFSYVYGDNHTGLTGDGEIDIEGLIGVSVDVTVLPDSYGRAAGTPEYLFDIGWVTLGTADGWLRSRRIDSDGTLVLPQGRAAALTKVGYTLAAGVEVEIRELVREP